MPTPTYVTMPMATGTATRVSWSWSRTMKSFRPGGQATATGVAREVRLSNAAPSLPRVIRETLNGSCSSLTKTTQPSRRIPREVVAHDQRGTRSEQDRESDRQDKRGSCPERLDEACA